MIPSKFQDVNIRIFTRDPSKMQAVQKAFRKCLGIITRTDMHSNPTVPVPDDYLIGSKKKRRLSTDSS